MKRLIAAVTVISVCIGISLYFSKNLKNELNKTKAGVEKIKACCLNGKYDAAFEESRSLYNGWESRILLNTTALKKESTENIEKNINEIYVTMSGKSYEKIPELCDSTVAEIEYLLHIEQLRFENIF
jgi:hypothetical protein